MNNREKIDAFVEECMAESKVDYVGLWQIAQTVREEFGSPSAIEIRNLSLEIVARLYERGLRPGDYWGGDFAYWPDEGCRVALDRIEREWIVAGADPNLAEPICWFAPRPE
jgi:hypothetical protein